MTTPSLVVFDLDFTLWDCGGTWCDCLTPPFRIDDGRVVDLNGLHVRLYRDVPALLDICDSRSIAMALASRTEQPSWARKLIDLLGIATRFRHAEIYPSSKLKHFSALREASGCEYSEMLFFDDEMRNIREVSTLDVSCQYVAEGLNQKLFDESLSKFGSRQVTRWSTVAWQVTRAREAKVLI